jgi:alpha-D-xyloside xylohydrolase
MWTPYSLSGVVTLPAKTTVKVTLRGGGSSPVLSARLRETGRTVFRSAAGDAVSYTFVQGASLDTVIAATRNVTGSVPMLPRWAFGFWHCRERFNTQEELLVAARKYRELRLPVDLIVQDWQYWGTHGWGAYEWDAKKYPDPAAMISELHNLNLKFMVSVWPNPSGQAGEELKKLPQGRVGNSGWYDPTSPAALALRWEWLNKSFFSIGTDSWWQDAAEPGDAGNSVYGSSLFIGSGDRHANAYPFFHSKGLYESQRAASEEKRVVNLTRSAFTGQQRFGAIAWSGDINGDWVTFRRQIPSGLNFSLTGQPFWTTDAGGFFRPKNPYVNKEHNELQARWFQWSTFCPILRIHGFQTRTEFWEWLPSTQAVLTDYTRLRYRMLPYNYSLAWQVSHANASMLRPLAMDFPNDPVAVATSDAYLYGPSFLVTPVTTPGAVTRDVYLPAGATWINFWTGEPHAGGQTVTTPADLATLPLHVRAGSIVPFGPELQYAAEKPAESIELRVYPGANGTFTLYEDEGDSYRYEKGAYATIPFTWDDATRTLTIGPRSGSFPGMLTKRTFRVVLVNPGAGTGTAFDSPAAVKVTYKGGKRRVVLK